MVDSRKGGTMTGEVDDVRKRVQAVEQKVDALSASVDVRFDAVDAALIEQRQYTEFAFDRLASEMRAGFSSVDARLNVSETRFDSIDSRFNRIERKLDRFIDTQSRANELVERRLRALEPPSGQL
jgi:tetrahydromethanopterin S-methyltransferase subunit G